MIERLIDLGTIRSFLNQDRDYAAYALGDLDPPYAEYAQWFAHQHDGSTSGIALYYPVLEPPVLFLMGDAPSLTHMLTECEFPDRVYFTAKPEFETLLARFYTLHECFQMYRMRVKSEDFVPFTLGSYQAVNLRSKQAGDVSDLLHQSAAADHRVEGDIAFVPEMIDDGYYYGLYDADQLIACAGTHIVATQSKIAAVGNVVVAPAERGKRLGAIVTSAVTAALLHDAFDLVVLNVRQDNAPAIATYRKLGYRITGNFIEGIAER